MTPAEAKFQEIGQTIPGIHLTQMFGKPTLKHNGKALSCFHNDCMVFKLGKPAHTEALALDGAVMFDPSDKGRPMKEWVQVPFAYVDLWAAFAKAALAFIEEK